MNQGRGIQIFKNQKDIIDFIISKKPSSKWVVQKYIERPLLFKGWKFDIRVWALKTLDHVYFYKEGYLRTSSTPFTLDIENNKNVHLTNNCFQKHLDNYGTFEPGNTISF